MIKIKDTEVMGMRKAIKGMRNALNSWDKSDSNIASCLEPITRCEKCPYNFVVCNESEFFFIGDKDMDLAKRLIKAGSPDRKFMRMIHVQADVLGPLYWWKQADQYRIGVTTNSTSTMHTIHKKELMLDDFSIDHFWDETNEVHGSVPSYKGKNSSYWLEDLLEYLNWIRTKFIETKDKAYWWQIIQLLPSSFNQMRTIDLSYETLFSIYHQRKNHKLDEWKEFCKWIETLPYMRDFLGLNDSETAEDKTGE